MEGKKQKDFFISNISTRDFLPFLFLSNILMLQQYCSNVFHQNPFSSKHVHNLTTSHRLHDHPSSSLLDYYNRFLSSLLASAFSKATSMILLKGKSCYFCQKMHNCNLIMRKYQADPIETVYKITYQYTLKVSKFMKDKKKLKNCHGLEEKESE